jgi:preprotein translocase subunit SecA
MENITRLFGFRPRIGPGDLGEEAFENLRIEELTDLIKEQARDAYRKRQEQIGLEDLSALERYVILQIIDNQWIAHLQDMDHMKEGIGLRGYGQLDPLREYKKEGYALFEELMDRIREETLITLSRIPVLRQRTDDEALPKKKKRAMHFSHGDEGGKAETVRREGKKIGRNAPCPCGSGKKYKKCCGAA